MFIKGTCKKCGLTATFDIGTMDMGEVKLRLHEMEFGECQAGGWHVELGKMTDYFDINYDNVTETK